MTNGRGGVDRRLLRGRIVTPTGITEDGWLDIDAGRIVALGSGTPPIDAPSATETTDLDGAQVVAGFIDLHVHGGGGATFTDGDPEAARHALAFHRSNGTTTSLLSMVSAPVEDLAGVVARLTPLIEDDRRADGMPGAAAGLHLEGPFLSPQACGAHDPSVLVDPTPGDLGRLLDAGAGTISMMTVAPERTGALDAVAELRDRGVVAAIGHTAASYERTRDAIDAGATVATHLFNAMSPLGHRSPGAVGAVLEDPRVVCELILDGHHLHPAAARIAIAAAGSERVALITDAISCAGMGGGPARLGTRQVVLADGAVRLDRGDGQVGALAGSTLTAAAAFRGALGLGVDWVDASRMASAVPARVLGLDGDRGSIERGLAADLVILDADAQVVEVIGGFSDTSGPMERWTG